MNSPYEVLVCARDAEVLAALAGGDHVATVGEHAAAGALADLVTTAHRVPDGELPANRVSLNSRITYREPGGASRTVRLVHPRHANPALLHISVLSPVGRALLGRKLGSTITVALPGGRGIELRIVDVARD